MTVRTLGDRIKVKRYELGLSYRELARQTGISRTLLKQWEDDILVPSLAEIQVLAAVLELDRT